MCACHDAVFILPVSQNTPLTPQLPLQLSCMFWEALLHYGTKKKEGEAGYKRRSGNANRFKVSEQLGWQAEKSKREKWLPDCVSWPVRSGHIISRPYRFSLAP